MAPQARAFLADLQAAVKAADKKKVASMVRYPLLVNSGGGHRNVRTAAVFLREYDSLFTAPVRKAIAEQDPACLFANYQGVMIGSGEVWYEEQKDGGMKIKTLNVPN